ncbi:MAG: glycosyltransferase family 39 protein, partial [Chloroflexi bacterium]|nr:glycosyltransferase family 39 protein [Chloroflexota bacterium]
MIARCRPGRVGLLRWLPLAFILAFGCFLRVYQIGQSCFWYDEAQTLLVARLPLGQIALTAYRPPLYHYILHFWSMLVPSTEFWLRIPSLVFGLLALGGVALVANQLYGRKTALVAALLAAISPVMVYYSQELRMYSLMTAIFLAIYYLFNRLILERSEHWSKWVLLWLAEVIALYSHYFSAPFLLTISALAIGACLLEQRRQTLWKWLATQAAVVVAFVPWLLVIFGGRGGISDYTAAELAPVNPVVPQVDDFLKQLAGFYTQGPQIWDQPADRILLLVIAAGLALAFVLIIGEVMRKTPHTEPATPGQPASRWVNADVILILVCLLPVLFASVLFLIKPGVVSPRHLMMLSGPLMILLARGAGIIWKLPTLVRIKLPAWAGHVLALVFLAAVLGIEGYSQWRNMRSSESLRPNVRALAQVVAQYAGPNDLVLMPYQDYAFDYYFGDRARVYHLETRVPDVDLMNWALPRMAGAERAVLIRWVDVYADPREYLAWFLQSNGKQVYKGWVADRQVTAFTLNDKLKLPEFTPIDIQAQIVKLNAGAWPDTVPADQALAAGLSWEALQVPQKDLKVSLRLVDGYGIVWARDDRYLMAERGNATTSSWQPGSASRNYYLVKLPAGAPPVTYSLQITVYDNDKEYQFTDSAGAPLGNSYTLGSVRVTAADDIPAAFAQDTPMMPAEQELAPGLQLVGYQVDRSQLQPGAGAFVILYWKALDAGLADYPVSLELISSTGLVVGSQQGAPANGAFPTSRWREGELIIDRRLLRADTTAEAGQARVVLSIPGYGQLELGEVQIEASTRSFVLPKVQYQADAVFGGVARLRGYDLEGSSAKLGQPFSLTLYWEALNQQDLGTDYVVFAHLLDKDGKVIAQHDGAPNNSTEPTSAWVAG